MHSESPLPLEHDDRGWPSAITLHLSSSISPLKPTVAFLFPPDRRVFMVLTAEFMPCLELPLRPLYEWPMHRQLHLLFGLTGHALR
jgi:hypothetical protein